MSKRKPKNEAVTEVEATNEVEATETTTEATEETTTAEATDEANNEPPVEDVNTRAVPGNNSDIIKTKRTKLLREVHSIGEANGKGALSLVKLAEAVLAGAMDGAITPDHAKPLYEAFRKGKSKALGSFEAPEKAASEGVQVSKLNAIIKLGCENDKLVESDGVITNAMDLIVAVRDRHVQYARGDDSKRLKTRSTYEAMLTIARKQLDEGKGLWFTEDQMDTYLLNEEHDKADKTALDLVKSALETLEKARDGKPDSAEKAGRAPLDHGNLDHAIGHLVQVISDLAPEYLEERNAKAKAKADKAQSKMQASA